MHTSQDDKIRTERRHRACKRSEMMKSSSCGILIPKVHTNGKIEDLFLKAENYVIFTDIQNSYKKGNCNSIPF